MGLSLRFYRHLGPGGPWPHLGPNGLTNVDRRIWRNKRKNENAPEKTPLQVREDLHVYRTPRTKMIKVRKDLNRKAPIPCYRHLVAIDI